MLAEPVGPRDAFRAYHAPRRAAALQELRELLTDLRDASADGRKLANQYADLLRAAVDGYCVEFDKRAEALLRRLGADA